MASWKIAGAFCVCAAWGDAEEEAHVGKSIFEVGNKQVVETREGMMSPEEFYKQYANLDVGKPVIFKGIAKAMPAFKKWSDTPYMVEHFGKQFLGVEDIPENQVNADKAKKNFKGKAGVQVLKTTTVKDFTDDFMTKPLYAADSTPRAMAQHVFLPPMLNCGGFQAALASSTLWWSHAATKSRIHADDFENINCQFVGRKRWALWQKSDQQKIKVKDMGWVKSASASGAYGSAANLDVTDVNLTAFPGWQDLDRYEATVEAGDCIFVPEDWAQTVWSDGEGPFISVNMHFATPTSFDERSCYRLSERGFKETSFLSTLRDCNYAGTEVHDKVTHCVKRGSMPTGDETDERFYNVTGFCDSRKDVLPEHDANLKKYIASLDQWEAPAKAAKEEL